MNKIMQISIIILTKNAGKGFRSVLSELYNQSINFLEVIIIDSNSTDDTLKIAKEYPVKIIRVNPEKFRHGKIRNLGANLAKGSYLVFLTQDAIPSNIDWLKELTEPFSDPNIAGIYGRQIPKKDANITDKVFYISMYPDKSFLLSGPRKDKVDAIFSNVNSAIRKDILLRYPFDNDIIVTEDHEWANRILKEGYAILYNSKASVFHSHSYNLKSLFKRYFDIGVSYNNICPNNITYHMIKKGIYVFLNEQIFLIRNGYTYLIPYCAIRDLFIFIALMVGHFEKFLPVNMKIHFSNYRWYWDDNVVGPKSWKKKETYLRDG